MIIRCSRRTLLSGSIAAAAAVALPPLPLYGSTETTDIGDQLPDLRDPEFWYKSFRDLTLTGLSLLPGAGNLMSMFASFLLPKRLEEPVDERWLQYVVAINKIVDEKIDEAIYSTVQDHLEGITAQTRLYNAAMDSKDEAHISNTEAAVNSFITGIMPSFMNMERRVVLLPLFVPAANIHLSLLRQAAQRNRLNGQGNVADTYANELESYIYTYTRHYDEASAQALDTVREANPFNRHKKRNQPWAAMLTLQSTSQISMGDLRDCWPRFSEISFPTEARPRLDREIFTPLLGSYFDGKEPPATLPRQGRPTGPIESLAVGGHEFVDGMSVQYGANNGPGGVSSTTIGGRGGTWWTIDDVVAREHIVAVETHSGIALDSIRFMFGDGSLSEWSGGYSGDSSPPVTHAYSDHRLSSIQGFGRAPGYGGVISGCILGFQLLEMEAPRKLSPAVQLHLLTVMPAAAIPQVLLN